MAHDLYKALTFTGSESVEDLQNLRQDLYKQACDEEVFDILEQIATYLGRIDAGRKAWFEADGFTITAHYHDVYVFAHDTGKTCLASNYSDNDGCIFVPGPWLHQIDDLTQKACVALQNHFKAENDQACRAIISKLTYPNIH